MKKTIITFALLILSLLILFQLSKYGFNSGDLKIETIIAMVAIVFFLVGIYINKRSLHQEGIQNGKIDLEKVRTLNLSDREYEVLKEVSLGLSNKEIAEKLFLSENTIKTHVSNILLKLNAKRRTQAVQIAKEMHII